MAKQKRILVDMDNVLADFDARMIELWHGLWPHDNIAKHVIGRTQLEFPTDRNIENMSTKFKQIFYGKDFFKGMKPVDAPHYLLALEHMLGSDIDVRILTSAGRKASHAFSEKAHWVAQHLGKEWVERLIISPDKHMVDGDILIDDIAEPRGSDQPHSWEHVVFDQSYNQHVTGKRRLNWRNYQEVLEI